MSKTARTYILSILLALAVGGLSALLSGGGSGFYETIVTPPLAPPPIVFPIVWTILYALMGISAARIYIKDPNSPSLKIYVLQLAVNFLWSIIFFNLRAFLLAFIWLLLLLVLIILMIVRMSETDRAAAFLQIPYLIWVTFAGYLTLAIYLLNTPI